MGVVFEALAAVAIVAGRDEWAKTAAAQPRPAREVPKFRVDPSWPRLPAEKKWERSKNFVT